MSKEAKAGRRAPLVTATLMVACGLFFAYQAGLTAAEREQLVLVWGAIPLEITEQDLPPHTPVSTVPTLLTSLFMHFSLYHIASNLFFLALAAPSVERALGPLRFFTLYIIGGVAATLGQVLVYPASLFPIVGASGAIAAVLAAYVAVCPRIWPQGVVLAIWLAPQLSGGFGPPQATEQWQSGTATWSHAGGLVSGCVLAFLLRGRSGRRPVSCRT